VENLNGRLVERIVHRVIQGYNELLRTYHNPHIKAGTPW